MLEGLEVLFLYVGGQVFSLCARYFLLQTAREWSNEQGMKQSPFRFLIYAMEWMSRFWLWMRILGFAADAIVFLFSRENFFEVLSQRVMRMEPSVEQMHYAKFVVWILNFY